MSSRLVIVLDLLPDPNFLQRNDKNTSIDKIWIQKVLQPLIVFLKSVLLLGSNNELSIILSDPEGAEWAFVWESNNSTNIGMSCFMSLQTTIEKSLAKVKANGEHVAFSSLSNALSLALCYFNKSKIVSTEEYSERILVINSSADCPVKYVNMMNCFFSAQKRVSLKGFDYF
jgi:hypothetical protein